MVDQATEVAGVLKGMSDIVRSKFGVSATEAKGAGISGRATSCRLAPNFRL